jgi:hypothetical protein
MLDGTNEITKEIMKMIKTNGMFNSKIAISQKPLQMGSLHFEYKTRKGGRTS